MKKRLQRLGYQTHNYGYRSVRGTLTDHAQQLQTRLRQLAEEHSVVHVVAHSMGAIVTRLALSDVSITGRLVLIAPPNRGAPLASAVGPLLRPILPIVDQLSSRPSSFVNQLTGPSDLDIGVIAGKLDLIVPTSCTPLANQTDHLRLWSSHNVMLFQPRVVRLVHHFLQNGKFRMGGRSSC